MKTKKKMLYKKKYRGGDDELVPYANDDKESSETKEEKEIEEEKEKEKEKEIEEEKEKEKEIEEEKEKEKGIEIEEKEEEKKEKNDKINYPLLQPVEVPSLVEIPFKITKNAFNWGVDTIKNSTIVNSISNSIFNSLKNNLGSINNVLTNNEITTLINEMSKNFIVFFGNMIEEVGEEVTNEFLEIFFDMLYNVGTRLINGFSNVAIKLLMSFIGEIPVAGGAVDLIVTVVTSFNDVIKSITPIIRSSIKVITSSLNIFNKSSSDIMSNPNFNKLKGNVDLFSEKVFGGMTFFDFLSNMFNTMKGSVSNLFGSYNTDSLKNKLKDVTNNTFNYGKKMSDKLQQKYNPSARANTPSSSSPEDAPPSSSAPDEPDAPNAPEEEKKALQYFGYTNLDDVTKDDLRKQYKELSLKYHPDKNVGNENENENENEAEEKFKELSENYSYLMEKKNFLGGRRTRKMYRKRKNNNKRKTFKKSKKVKKVKKVKRGISSKRK